jgi:sugar lactone lactonase YvrE
MNVARLTGHAMAFASLVAVQACGGSGEGDNNVRPPPELTGKIALFAGDVGGIGNLDGVRSDATFYGIQSLAVDPAGNLMVAEVGNHALRKISTDGMVGTAAGGDMVAAFADGQGAAAKFVNPQFVAADTKGNWYVSDNGDYIRKVTPQGVVTTLANVSTDSNCQISSMAFCHVGKPLAVDAAGTVYFTANNQLRKLGANGQMETLVNAISSNGIPTPAFSFVYQPSGLVVDAQGTVYIADRNQPVIRKVSPAGAMTILAGSEESSQIVDGQGSDARFVGLEAITIDASGNLYVLEGNGAIRKVTPAGVVSTLRQPTHNLALRWAYNFVGFARDAAGNFYLSAPGTGGNAPVFGHPAILRIDAQGVESVYAGRQGVVGDTDGVGSAAQFSDPRSPSIDANGNVVVLDKFIDPNSHMQGHMDDSYSLRRISPEGGTTSIVRMDYQNAMSGAAVDRQGNVYVGGGRRIRVIAPDGTVKLFFEGSPGLPDGLKVLAVDSSGAVYAGAGSTVPASGLPIFVPTRPYGAIYKISSDKTVSLLAGKAGVQGLVDGAGESARFSSIGGGALDSAGNLYVADPANHVVRKVSPAGLVSTIAGQRGIPGYSDGAAAQAHFWFPVDVKIDGQDNLYVADRNNAAVRKISAGGVVSTVVGTAGKYGFVPSPLPSVIPPPEGIALTDSVLFITTRNGVLRAHL